MDDSPQPLPAQVVAAGYLLAVLCLLVPLAVVGSTFAGAVLRRRGLPSHGTGVIVLGVVCTAIGILLLR